MTTEADICIICEGSYPYSMGGVSQWVQELITEHQERTFHILTLVPPHPDLTLHYQFPKNVVGHTVYIVQDLPKGAREGLAPKETWDVLGPVLKGLISSPKFEDFTPILDFFNKHQEVLGKRILSESVSSWDFMIDLYKETIPSGPFKAYFATMYTLSRSFYSILLPTLPKAKLFHSVCTGYAGFILYRAKQEKKAPCILTEHGIYSNERRIEIAMADWIAELGSLDLALEDKTKTLKDFWLNAFFSFAHAAYISSDEVLSTFDGNQDIQLEGGADPLKTHTILHGIDSEKYASIRKNRKPHPPTVAFIGRIVPIKDVKTFIRACSIVKSQLPDIRFYALGPTDEEPEYFAECMKFTELLGLTNHLTFLGRVDLKEYFPEIDLIVLTSLSEAQPLVMLEGGAMGIPSVATNVGACHQIINGKEDESPSLGEGGIITPLVDPDATAAAVIRLLTDSDFYNHCSETIEKRIKTYYKYQQEQAQYRKIYDSYLQS